MIKTGKDEFILVGAFDLQFMEEYFFHLKKLFHFHLSYQEKPQSCCVLLGIWMCSLQNTPQSLPVAYLNVKEHMWVAGKHIFASYYLSPIQ